MYVTCPTRDFHDRFIFDGTATIAPPQLPAELSWDTPRRGRMELWLFLHMVPTFYPSNVD